MRRLLTIPISHYCEKARWGLDRAGVDYREERHVQVIHRVAARRAGGGLTLPVLVTADDGVFSESEDILRYADGFVDEDRRLFPADPAQRAEVEELCRWLDAGLGPDGRRWIYAQMLPYKELTQSFNNDGVPAWEARALNATWPVATAMVKRVLNVTATTAVDDEPRVRASFDAIGQRLADGRPYLCGDRFTAADLTFAALSAPVTAPPQYGVRLPQPEEMPDELAGWVRTYREHPAGQFALRMFATERGADAAMRAPAPAGPPSLG